jgi:glycosyltransferase involved in cell wall biosynthesis
MKSKIILIHRIFASYRKPIYDKLAEIYDFLLLHGLNDKTIKQATTPYSKSIKAFQYSKNDTHLFLKSFTKLLKVGPKVVIHEFAIGILSLLPMYVCCKLLGTKFILYSHGYNRLTGFHPEKSWSDKYRVFLMKRADAIILYTNSDKERLSTHIKSDKIFVAQNTLDTKHLVEIRNHLAEEGKEKLKLRLGFTHKYNLTFIGRLLGEKMPETVLHVFDIIQKKLPNQVGIHFVGGGDITPLQAIVDSKKWQNHVTFHGAVYEDKKSGEFLYASDMMIMPGYLGLAVNHAFIFDCPVVSFLQTENGPFHSPEIEYVVENETGFLIPDLSVEKMANAIVSYLQNEPLQLKTKENIRFKMENELTIDNMVKGFTDAIDYVLQPKLASALSKPVVSDLSELA